MVADDASRLEIDHGLPEHCSARRFCPGQIDRNTAAQTARTGYNDSISRSLDAAANHQK